MSDERNGTTLMPSRHAVTRAHIYGVRVPVRFALLYARIGAMFSDVRWWLGWTVPRAIAVYFDGIARRTNNHPRCSVCGRK